MGKRGHVAFFLFSFLTFDIFSVSCFLALSGWLASVFLEVCARARDFRARFLRLPQWRCRFLCRRPHGVLLLVLFFFVCVFVVVVVLLLLLLVVLVIVVIVVVVVGVVGRTWFSTLPLLLVFTLVL